MTEERVIRKYANRRLYDAADSRHVTLEDIRRMIGSGERVKVVDDRTGEDVTRSILLQIIANQEQFGTPVLSTQLLEAIIRFYGNPVQELLSRHLEQSVGGMLRQQEIMRAEMAKVLESPLAPMADMARQNMELWAKMQASMMSAFTPGVTPPRAGHAPSGADAPAGATGTSQPRTEREGSRGASVPPGAAAAEKARHSATPTGGATRRPPDPAEPSRGGAGVSGAPAGPRKRGRPRRRRD